MTEEGLHRTTVNLSSEANDALARYIARHGVTRTEAIRRALLRLDFLDRDDVHVLRDAGHGVVREVEFRS